MRKALPADFFDLYSRRQRHDAFTIAMLAFNGFIGITRRFGWNKDFMVLPAGAFEVSHFPWPD